MKIKKERKNWLVIVLFLSVSLILLYWMTSYPRIQAKEGSSSETIFSETILKNESSEEKKRSFTDTAEVTNQVQTQKYGLWGTCKWSFSAATGKLYIGPAPAGLPLILGVVEQSPWNRVGEMKVPGDRIRGIVFTDFIKAPVDSGFLFSSKKVDNNGYLINLVEIKGLDFLNTSDTTDMRGMFYQAGSLTSLNVSSFDTSKVTRMQSMFNGTGSLTTLDVSNFNTSSVANMQAMFAGTGLTSLDLQTFNTTQVTDFSQMFEDSRIINLNLKIPLSKNEEKILVLLSDLSVINYISISDDRADKSNPWVLSAKAFMLTSGEGTVDGE